MAITTTTVTSTTLRTIYGIWLIRGTWTTTGKTSTYWRRASTICAGTITNASPKSCETSTFHTDSTYGAITRVTTGPGGNEWLRCIFSKAVSDQPSALSQV